MITNDFRVAVAAGNADVVRCGSGARSVHGGRHEWDRFDVDELRFGYWNVTHTVRWNIVAKAR